MEGNSIPGIGQEHKGTGRVIGTAAGGHAGALEWPEEVTYAVVTEPGTRP